MSRNLRDTTYRQFDVDELEDAHILDSLVEPIDPAFGDATGPNQAELKKLIDGNRFFDALALVLQNPPLKGDQETKNATAQAVLKLLTSFKQSEVEGVIKKLNEKQLLMLVKYIYKVMELTQDFQTSQLLCAWNTACFNESGYGPIGYTLCSRYRL
ncbi:Actin-related protein 2/3 complex subunit 5 [Aphelenchoides fujianensis]|nr:Actin-related protein 2/3 complex subunit 5 [Aphelenchoides fujianensis]